MMFIARSNHIWPMFDLNAIRSSKLHRLAFCMLAHAKNVKIRKMNVELANGQKRDIGQLSEVYLLQQIRKIYKRAESMHKNQVNTTFLFWNSTNWPFQTNARLDCQCTLRRMNLDWIIDPDLCPIARGMRFVIHLRHNMRNFHWQKQNKK